MNQSIITQENKKSSAEEQIQHCLQLMKEELGSKEGPNFKRFWEVRKECLTLFKGNLSPLLRTQLWENYVALADEARIAKEHVEEESKFAAGQLDLAIDALEREIKQWEENPKGIHSPAVTEGQLVPTPKSIFEAQYKNYLRIQERIELLTMFGAKVNDLRKELVKMPIRMRSKTKGLDRLGHLGDQIFPKKKQLVGELSEQFMQDIEKFVQQNFSTEKFDHEKMKRSLFFFREEIKQLQAFGTFLSLNSASFTFMRKNLSLCWDQLRGMEKELKKDFSEQKVKSAANAKLIRERIELCKERLAKEELSLEALATEVRAIQLCMKEMELVRSDVLLLKEEVALLMTPLREKERQEEEEKATKMAAEEAARTLLFEEFALKIEEFSNSFADKEINELLTQHVSYKKELQTLRIQKESKQQLEKKLKIILDRIHELKEDRLLSLSSEDKNALEILQLALLEKKEIRKSLKQNLENLRKKKGGRALDVLQALEVEDLIESEKEQLVKVEHMIEEIEDKISQFN